LKPGPRSPVAGLRAKATHAPCMYLLNAISLDVGGMERVDLLYVPNTRGISELWYARRSGLELRSGNTPEGVERLQPTFLKKSAAYIPA
jgi:hypothetical protein